VNRAVCILSSKLAALFVDNGRGPEPMSSSHEAVFINEEVMRVRGEEP
jgi:hypothetical protein